jgi:hypothetical protein
MDIFGIVSKNSFLSDKMTIPNSSQYKAIEYFKKEIKRENYHIIVRSRTDKEVFYEDQKILTILSGKIYIGNKEINLREFTKLYTIEKHQIFKRIKGMFNLVIIEKLPLKVKIISDHFGLIPIFYYFNNEKLILSTKLDFVKQNAGDRSNILEYMAILEQIYLNYILGEKTYYKNIYMQNAGSILEFIFTNFNINKKETIYWHLSEIIGKFELSYNNALERYAHEFYDIVNSAVENSQSPILAFTAGYDTRINFAVLRKKFKNMPCFSYGIKDSLDVKIPLLIREKIGINYTPLYLDGPFEEKFDDFAMNAIFHSDGLGDLEKANNEYAYSYLSSKYSDVIVGLFGSEFLKSHTFPNRLVPESILKYFSSLKDYNPNFNSYSFNKDLIYDFSQNISKYIRDKYLDQYQNLCNDHKLFLFYYYEGVRKYFMKELRIGRYYVNITMPFIDKELLEILVKSKLTNIYYSLQLRNSFLRKQKVHFVYSYIIKRYMPTLLDVITNRGYKPKYDLSFLSRLFILPYYLKQKMKKQKPQYLYNVWARSFIDRYINILKTSDVLKPLFPNNQINIDINDAEKLHRLLSIAVYLNGLSR